MLKTMFGELAWRPRNLWAEVEETRAANEQSGPAHWTDAVVLVMQRLFAGWTGRRFLQALAWFVLWLAAWLSAIPFFTWPFPDPFAAKQAALVFAGGASLVPLGIGLLCPTRTDVYWQAQKLATPGLVRFYTHAGAAMGYTTSLILLFFGALGIYYLSGRPLAAWLLGVLLVPALVIGLTGARQAPVNLWRAYRSLALRHGWFLAVFFGVGILWAVYFYLFYPWLLNRVLGALILLIAFAIVGTIAIKQQRSDK